MTVFIFGWIMPLICMYLIKMVVRVWWPFGILYINLAQCRQNVMFCIGAFANLSHKNGCLLLLWYSVFKSNIKYCFEHTRTYSMTFGSEGPSNRLLICVFAQSMKTHNYINICYAQLIDVLALCIVWLYFE